MPAASATRASTTAETPARGTPAANSRGAAAGGAMRDARVSSILSGKPLYRMSDGRLVELPKGMTAQETAMLEAEARAAQQKLGKGPAPKPVPEVRKAADKREKGKAEPKAPTKKGAGGGAMPAIRTAPVVARLKAVGGKVAKYLLAKAAPVLVKGVGLLRTLSRHEQTHDDAATKRRQAEKAVVNPASENQSRSNAGQVGMIEARPAPPVDPNAGKQKLQQSLADNVPKTIEDVDHFKRDMKGQHIGADVLKVVQGDKNAVIGTFADMERTPPPAPPEQTPEALPPPEVAPATANLDLGAGAVAPIAPEHTDVSNFTREADGKLKEEGVTQEQLDMVDSGDLAAAKTEKKGMEARARTEPAAIQQFSRQQTAKVDQELKNEEKQQRGALVAKRKNGLTGSAQKQKKAKSDLEKKRDEVAARINGIHRTVQDKVRKQLADLETQSMKRFDDGNTAATRAFEDDVKKELDDFKRDRYSGVFGWARKAKDWLLGMEDLPGVKAIFDRNRAKFVATIDKLVADIGADNKRAIQDCKDQLARARQEIKDYVDKLGPALKAIGQKTASDVGRQLDEMDGFIRRKEEELQQRLADRQQAAIKAIDDKIEKMKEAMSGALAKLGKLLLWAAKKFFTWALSKFGYSLAEIESIISKGAAVLKAIFTKPIVFVKNLMNAAITGFQNFGKNFLKHLKDALFEWLTGSLQGVTLPTTWDARGVAGLALQMLGISYANIRRHMVAVMGEPVVAGLEKTFTLVKTLITEGPMAAWEQLKDMAGVMRDAFVDAVKDFIKQKVIEEAIKWIGALFVPGAGIIKAVIGIYDTIVFFIQKAKDIAQMIGRFLGAIGEIAAGNIGAAAQAMEDGLARGLVLVINFLASLLRLNAITAKIRAAIQKIRDKVDAALAKVAKWVAEKAKSVIKSVAGGVKAGVQRVADWWRERKGFTIDDEQHELSVQGEPSKPDIKMASARPQSVRELLAKRPGNATTVACLKVVDDLEKLIKAHTASQGSSPETDGIRAQIRARLAQLATLLPSVFGGPLPLTTITYKMSGGLAKTATAMPLTRRAGNTEPSKATSAPILADTYMTALNATSMQWVKMHMVSWRMMGPNADWNFAAGDKSANGNMTALELATEKAIKGPAPASASDPDERIRWYETKVTYQKDDPANPNIKYFAKTMEVTEGRYNPANGAKTSKTHGPWTSAKPPLAATMLVVDFSQSGRSIIEKSVDPATGLKLGSTAGQRIVDARGLMAAAEGRRNWGAGKAAEKRFRQYMRDAGVSDSVIDRLLDLTRKYPTLFRLQ
ncbi:hypothetical protein [Solimonas soli]|uniref:hypothetical protein n=1 Tax=Solimonas soli TaxID=413479 RepID=UPI0004AF78EF|nr:hypothetical protein [Solimonas soli]